jgi:hypothetical protein
VAEYHRDTHCETDDNVDEHDRPIGSRRFDDRRSAQHAREHDHDREKANESREKNREPGHATNQHPKNRENPIDYRCRRIAFISEFSKGVATPVAIGAQLPILPRLSDSTARSSTFCKKS